MWKKLAGAYEYQAFRILQLLFFIVSIGKGLNKVLFRLTGTNYLNSPLTDLILQRIDTHFVFSIGILEIVIGIGILFKPKFFSYLLVVWFSIVVITFLSLMRYLDVALQDCVLILVALALGQLSHKYSS